MPVFGFVINAYAQGDLETLEQSLNALEADLTLGPWGERGLALVLATETQSAEGPVVEAIEALDGVAAVHLVYADFSDLDLGTIDQAPLLRRGRHGRSAREPKLRLGGQGS